MERWVLAGCILWSGGSWVVVYCGAVGPGWLYVVERWVLEVVEGAPKIERGFLGFYWTTVNGWNSKCTIYRGDV